MATIYRMTTARIKIGNYKDRPSLDWNNGKPSDKVYLGPMFVRTPVDPVVPDVPGYEFSLIRTDLVGVSYLWTWEGYRVEKRQRAPKTHLRQRRP